MAQSLQLNNFDSPNIRETSQLGADVAVGATTLSIQFTDDMEVDDLLYLGRLGSEAGEKVVVSSITDTDTLVAAPGATKPHNRYDDVTSIFGDVIKVYRAANTDGSTPDDSNFNFLDSLNIDFDQLTTSYVDDTGTSDYWYKYIYQNSLSGQESDLADSAAVRGGGYGNYASIQSIRTEAGLQNNRWITDTRIDEKRQAAQSFINSTLSGIYTLPFSRPINPLITEITELLAAGYLLTDNYGPLGTLNTNEGQQKIDRVTNKDKTGLLDRLNTKELVLTDQNGSDTSIEGTGNSFGGWPDATTADADPEDGGGSRMFRVSDRF